MLDIQDKAIAKTEVTIPINNGVKCDIYINRGHRWYVVSQTENTVVIEREFVKLELSRKMFEDIFNIATIYRGKY